MLAPSPLLPRPSLRPGFLILAALAASCSPAVWAQGAAEAHPFELGTITVTAARPQIGEIGQDQVASVVTQQEMRTFNRDNVGDAINLLSGVTVSNNSRNEKTVFLRGFDARQAVRKVQKGALPRLLFPRKRAVIRCDEIDFPVRNRVPERLVVFRPAKRRRRGKKMPPGTVVDIF